MARPHRKPPTTAEMVAVARMFYGQNLQKKEIAGRLKVSNQTVTRILDEARRVGLVQIQIPEGLERELEVRVRQRFPHLIEVLIVPSQIAGETEQGKKPATVPKLDGGLRPDGPLLRRFASVAAEYLDRLVYNAGQGSLRVGVTGGESLLEFANAVPDRLRERVHFYPTALVGRGRVPESSFHVDAVAIATILWARSGRLPDHCHYATVPPYDTKARSKKARKYIQDVLATMAASPSIRSIVREMDDIDVAFAGIGVVNAAGRMSMTGLLNPVITSLELREEGAVADFCYNLIDEEGQGNDRWRFFLTAGHYSSRPGLAFFQHMVESGKTVIAIAGPRKEDAIRATLRAKVFNVWITDSDTAKKIADRP